MGENKELLELDGVVDDKYCAFAIVSENALKQAINNVTSKGGEIKKIDIHNLYFNIGNDYLYVGKEGVYSKNKFDRAKEIGKQLGKYIQHFHLVKRPSKDNPMLILGSKDIEKEIPKNNDKDNPLYIVIAPIEKNGVNRGVLEDE